MSNSIWKTPDETPASCFLCVFDRPMGRSVGHYNPVKKQFCSGELRFEHKDIDKFCMIDDLIAQADKAERLRKALDVAIERLNLMSRETFQGEPSSINMGFRVRAEAALADIDEIIALG